MKKYTKPVLMTLSVSANDMLCGGCGSGAIMGSPAESFFLQYFDTNGDSRVDWTDFGTDLFASAESCTDTDPMVEGYCKQTAGNIIIWS